MLSSCLCKAFCGLLVASSDLCRATHLSAGSGSNIQTKYGLGNQGLNKQVNRLLWGLCCTQRLRCSEVPEVVHTISATILLNSDDTYAPSPKGPTTFMALVDFKVTTRSNPFKAHASLCQIFTWTLWLNAWLREEGVVVGARNGAATDTISRRHLEL